MCCLKGGDLLDLQTFPMSSLMTYCGHRIILMKLLDLTQGPVGLEIEVLPCANIAPPVLAQHQCWLTSSLWCYRQSICCPLRHPLLKIKSFHRRLLLRPIHERYTFPILFQSFPEYLRLVALVPSTRKPNNQPRHGLLGLHSPQPRATNPRSLHGFHSTRARPSDPQRPLQRQFPPTLQSRHRHHLPMHQPRARPANRQMPLAHRRIPNPHGRKSSLRLGRCPGALFHHLH